MNLSPDFYGIAFVAALIVMAGAYLLLRHLVTELVRFRGKRVVTCPDRLTPEAVEIDTLRAVVSSFFGEPRFRLNDCSRWPEMRNCQQDCVRQIEAAPLGCLIRNLLEGWYAGKDCVLCSRPLGHIDWYERQPAVRNPEGVTREWRDIPATQVPEVLATHLPVCWNCHVAERFRREHPELVIDRHRTEVPAHRQHAS